jgi:3-hydroxyacyl-CoA dehydrogenase
MGKTPVEANDFPGFIANRIFFVGALLPQFKIEIA